MKALGIVVGLALGVTWWGLVVYVLYHFITKYW